MFSVLLITSAFLHNFQNVLENKIESFNLTTRAILKDLDSFDRIGHFGQIWDNFDTIWTKLDNVDCGQKLDNVDKSQNGQN